MLQADVVQQLNLIAYEGWEYHKLSLEAWELPGSSQSNWDLNSLAGAGFQPHGENIYPDQSTPDQAALTKIEQ